MWQYKLYNKNTLWLTTSVWYVPVKATNTFYRGYWKKLCYNRNVKQSELCFTTFMNFFRYFAHQWLFNTFLLYAGNRRDQTAQSRQDTSIKGHYETTSACDTLKLRMGMPLFINPSENISFRFYSNYESALSRYSGFLSLLLRSGNYFVTCMFFHLLQFVGISNKTTITD